MLRVSGRTQSALRRTARRLQTLLHRVRRSRGCARPSGLQLMLQTSAAPRRRLTRDQLTNGALHCAQCGIFIVQDTAWYSCGRLHSKVVMLIYLPPVDCVRALR